MKTATHALLEIDFQRWIVALTHDPDVIERARQARQHWRKNGADVYCLRYLSPTDDPRSDPKAPDALFVDPMGPEPGDVVLSKYTRNAFDNPDLHTNLTLRGTTHVVLTGLLTDHGVTEAALSAQRLGYNVTVLRDATASTDPHAHQNTLRQLEQRGITIQ